jgi:hypothetical protein
MHPYTAISGNTCKTKVNTIIRRKDGGTCGRDIKRQRKGRV